MALRKRQLFGGSHRETGIKNGNQKVYNPVSIGDNSQGNGTAGRLPA